jgi:uncharacterized membrane protein
MERKDNTSYRVDWNTLRKEWPLWLIMGGLMLSAVILYPNLPAQVPGHWNIYGEVDAYYPKAFSVFFPPLLALGLYLMFLFLPLIDPKRSNYQRFTGAYAVMRWGWVIFMGILYVVTMMVSLGYSVDIGLMVKVLVAVLFLIIGNYMGQFRHNYFVGIKTPWTLANEEVWQATHRFGGKIWVAGSLVCLVMAPISAAWSAYVFLACIVIMAVIPVVYSYLLFARLQSK